MSIDPLRLNVKPISEITTVNNPTEGHLLFYDGSDELKKTNVSDFYNAMQSAYLGIATTTTTPPATGAYWYRVTTAGTYTNFLSGGSPVVVTEGDFYDGTKYYDVTIEVKDNVATKRVNQVNNAEVFQTINSYSVDSEQIVPSEALYNDETLAGDILKRVDKVSGDNVNYREVTTWYDGTPMTDAKLDNVIFIKKGGKYYKKQIDKQTLLKVNTIADLRNFNGYYEGQEVVLMGYYEAGDKEPLTYKWTLTQGVDDGGSIINSNVGSWEAQFSQQVDVRSYGVYPDNNLSSDKKSERINRIFELGYDVLITQEGVYMLSSPVADTELNSIIMPKSNTTLTIMPNVELKLDVNSPTMDITGGVYQIIYIKNITNFKLYGNGSIINGNKAEVSSKTSSGEWGHGIVISGSSLIEINDINCINCWGDGTNISKRDGLDNPSFVTFKNVLCDSNRRQGLSITGGRVIRINNSQFLNTNGVDPSAGIDVEPNALEGTVIEDVIFDNIKVLGNRLGVAFYDLQLNTEKTNNIKIVNSDIEALLFYSSNVGGVTPGIHNISIRDTKIGSSNSTFIYTLSTFGNVKNINIDNVQVYGGIRGVDMDFSKYNLPDQLCTINISNLKIFDFSNTGIYVSRDTNINVVLKSMLNDVFIYSSSYVRAYNIRGVTDFSGKNIDWYGSPTDSSILIATNINTYAVKGVINKSSTDFLFKPTTTGRAIFESPNGSITKALNLSDAGRLLIGTDTLVDTSRTATTTTTGIVRQSVTVSNVSSADATDLATALTLVNELKSKLNAKLTADRNSGQQAI